MNSRLVLALGLLNGCLYALLTPLWEGFDEPYHYGVVWRLAHEYHLPQYGPDTLPGEISQSLRLAPAAPAVSANHGGALTTFDQWFTLSPEERDRRRARWDHLDPAAPGEGRNYQSQHAPLAYLMLAPIDAALARVPLSMRIAVLRLFSTTGVILLLAWAVRLLGLTCDQETLALLCLFQSQMLYATIAHIGNDGVAVACTALVFAAVARRQDWLLGFALTAALLAKGYALAFLPVALWVARKKWWRVALPVALLAGPWYARNYLLYGNLTGMFTDARLSPAETFRTALQMPWSDTLVRLARFCLFTGNNHFTSFHQGTIYVGLALLTMAAVYVVRHGDRVLLALFGCFLAAWPWALMQTWARAHGESVALSPWYGQCLLAPFFVLAARHAPRWLLCTLVAFYTYLMAATWWLKLMPLYAGFTGGRANPLVLWRWVDASALHALSQTALAPAWVLLVLASLSTVSAMLLANAACIRRSENPRRDPGRA